MRLLGEKIATAIDNGDTVVIKFEKSNRYYDVDSDGNVEGPLEIVFDKNPGQLDGKGTEEEPFIIMSIEDLVYFSQQVNEVGNEYSGQHVVLGKTLDFNLDLSYVNVNTTEYDEYLGGDGTTGLKEQLTKGIGFRPIGESLDLCFTGFFDGYNNEIRNIKVETEGLGGLFGYIGGRSEESPTTIKNLIITGNISASNYAGGIVGEASYNYISLENLTNYANVTTSSIEGGGIVGRSFNTGGKIYFDKCFNYGNIISKGATGGIIGYGYRAKIQVKNSSNFAKLESTGDTYGCGVGGIVGGGSSPAVDVYNSSNYGTLLGTKRIGGICGHIINSSYPYVLVNVFNIGKTEKYGWTPGGLAGQDSSYPSILNAYYISTYQHGIGWGSVVAGTKYTEDQLQDSSFVDELNTNIENGCPYEVENDDETTTTVTIDTTGWAKWVYNENSYPTLDTTTIWNGTDWEKIEK